LPGYRYIDATIKNTGLNELKEQNTLFTDITKQALLDSKKEGR